MRNEGLGSWPARRARKTPHRTAVVHGDDDHSTYRPAARPHHPPRHALRDLGVRRGDRVAYLGPNHPSFLETLFAAGTLGAVFVPLNTRLAGPEIAYQLADSGARPSSTARRTPDWSRDSRAVPMCVRTSRSAPSTRRRWRGLRRRRSTTPVTPTTPA